MPIPRLRIDQAALLVIDVQERLMPTIVDREKLINNCSIMIRLAEELRLPYLVTEQYVKGLGRTVPEIVESMADASRRIEKTRFSALVDVMRERLEQWRRPSVIVCGIEAHVCVLQTVLDLQAAGWQTYVCSDAISASQRDQIPWALSRMQQAGSIITGVMSAMYELLDDAMHPSFRACLPLAKAVKW